MKKKSKNLFEFRKKIIKKAEKKGYKIKFFPLKLNIFRKPEIYFNDGTTNYLKKFKLIAEYNGYEIQHFKRVSLKMMSNFLIKNGERIEDIIILMTKKRRKQ